MKIKLPSLKDILNDDIDYLKDSHDMNTNNNNSKDNFSKLSLKNINQWNEMNGDEANNLSLLSSVSLNYTYDTNVHVDHEVSPDHGKDPVAVPGTHDHNHNHNHTHITLPSISTLPSIYPSPTTYSPYYQSPYYTPPSSINSPSPTSSPRLENSKIKRRQRLGPSCDCCRKRKVKCDADINVLSDCLDKYDYKYDSSLFSAQEWQSLLGGSSITRTNYIYLVSFGKLIKFKACSSCNSKNLACVFSKGFTKDDLLKKKKLVKEKNVKIVKKVVKTDFSLRKSSCVNCRKRKVKCVGGDLGCTGCEKKGIKCEFL